MQPFPSPHFQPNPESYGTELSTTPSGARTACKSSDGFAENATTETATIAFANSP
ncbi:MULTISPECIES: hypothetical protein [Leptolyngbya]|uniref:hypothetical protein n=1 Tax=Leptolyngbya TaxID=47251 RepID=UPI0003A65ACE|nr:MULTISPECIES: hypothetical protein [Leptolyngbya]MBD2370237.1 hypothetical protein [Leptolyngbya sp. FACHB-161]MBD2376583.1 hypothetical protein [Leptolyngbya sp. FACHB-238]MBD2400855.1 hypothetical protein [Leptolyngbya sp. FACHB-239]MBD2407399.1 hypothetical protein [Leptolyngbya sp. FACHB-402]